MSLRAPVAVVVGTRPEAIKLAPVILALRESGSLAPLVVTTGQHPAAEEVLSGWDIEPDLRLGIAVDSPDLAAFVSGALAALSGALAAHAGLRAVVVQGDTSTTLAGALAGAYLRLPVVHVEAGLRSHDPENPFPEELNRRLVTQVSRLHCAPTSLAAKNLYDEGVAAADVLITGNTVVDALRRVVGDARLHAATGRRGAGSAGRLVVVTAHRRESWDGGIAGIAGAVADIVTSVPDVRVVLPLHPQPVVRDAITEVLGDHPQVDLCPPMGHTAFVRLLERADLVITDSGGVQEEACCLGVPALVTRACTERSEGVGAGGLRLVGTDRARIAREALSLLTAPRAPGIARESLPFGDGYAAGRIVGGIEALLTGEPSAVRCEVAV